LFNREQCAMIKVIINDRTMVTLRERDDIHSSPSVIHDRQS
jgi:hypothetical protein